MDVRAAIPVLPPVSNPTVSYWQDPPDAEIADYRSSEVLPEEVDVLIIGSGITGASVAWGLLGEGQGTEEGKKKVCMLEARQVCSGATGRNGGHTKAASYRSFIDNASTHSTLTAVRIATFEYNTIKSLHAFAKKHNIECGLYEGDTVDIIYDETQLEEAVAGVEAMRDAMPDALEGVARYKIWAAEEARRRFKVGGDECLGAVSYGAGSLSAYAFVIGVLKLCLDKGLQLYANTPVVKIEKEMGGWVIHTSTGKIRAKKVVLATNGYTAAIWPAFQGAIVPLRGQITAHRPGSTLPIGKGGLELTYSFVYEDGYEYMIPRAASAGKEQAVIIGGGLAISPNDGEAEYGIVDDSALNPEISKYLEQSMPMYFGNEWGEDDVRGRVAKEWSGIMGFSPDGHPFVGEMEEGEGLWVCAGFQGHGMVLCWGCARAVVGMMSGEEVEEWFPEIFKVSGERMGLVFEGRLS